jgi:hypothetical protein
LFTKTGEGGAGEPAGQPELFQCPVRYSLLDNKGGKIADGEGKARLDGERLSVLPKLAEPLSVPYRDVVDAAPIDFTLRLALSSGETLTLFGLGYKYEDFVRVFSALRNEVLLKDLLMNESLRRTGVGVSLLHLDEAGRQLSTGRCQLRLYDTAVVLMPERGEFVRIPYSYISSAADEDHVLRLKTETGDQFLLSGMGEDFDSVSGTLSAVMNELGLKAQASLKELVPDADPSVIRRAARFLKDGRAASRSDIESVSPGLWDELEKRLELAGVKGEYEFLKGMSRQQKLCIGMKRGLMGDLTGDYIWFLIPIYGKGAGEPGNAVAMEASTGEGGGRATYFFRIMGRAAYRATEDAQLLDGETDTLVRNMNRCMLEINFRREPIYLPDSKLEEPQYVRYRYAVKKLQGLQILRNLYIGRVVHSSPDQWKKDVMDLLSFNVSTPDEDIKWSTTGHEVSAEDG